VSTKPSITNNLEIVIKFAQRLKSRSLICQIGQNTNNAKTRLVAGEHVSLQAFEN